MHGGGLGVGDEPVYDAAAAAVDMVALARNSGRKSGSLSGLANGNGSGSGAGGLGRPSGARNLASRSVGMAGELIDLGRLLKVHTYDGHTYDAQGLHGVFHSVFKRLRCD
jgi:hypothetical protein